jgi:propionate CoA-transferase
MGDFTAGGFEAHVENGKLVIDKEGKFTKFVPSCPQLTFNAAESLKKGNSVTYITERCVITRTKEGLNIVEVAPGIDYQKQIIDLCPGVKFNVPSGGPKPMLPEIFQEKWGKLKDHVAK